MSTLSSGTTLHLMCKLVNRNKQMNQHNSKTECTLYETNN
jgi:hypothetical protein